MAQSTPMHALFIGGGTMARALIAGATASGLKTKFSVVEPDASKHGQLLSPFRTLQEGFEHLRASETVPGGGQIVLATKPQVFPEVAEQLAPMLRAESCPAPRIMISILAGVSSQTIFEKLGCVRVVRTMPNTPAQIGQGMSAIAIGAGASRRDADFARVLLGSCGRVIDLDEDLLDAFTALAGSGPAYVFYLAEAMAKAGESLGFTPEQADSITRQTILGSAELLAKSPEFGAEELRARVTSKKGTTQAATDMLDGSDLNGIFRAALTAARDRGRGFARE